MWSSMPDCTCPRPVLYRTYVRWSIPEEELMLAMQVAGYAILWAASAHEAYPYSLRYSTPSLTQEWMGMYLPQAQIAGVWHHVKLCICLCRASA